MLHEQNLNVFTHHSVGYDIWRAGYDKLARAFNITSATNERIGCEKITGFLVNEADDSSSRAWILLCYVVANRGQLSEIPPSPCNAHDQSGLIVSVQDFGDFFLAGEIAIIGIIQTFPDTSDPLFLPSDRTTMC